jgi:putative ABC transport system substrate-binding protein
MSYGPDIDATYRQLATYVDKVLHGTPPGELPIEQPTAFKLVISKRAADTIGIALSPSLLATAERTCESSPLMSAFGGKADIA